MNPHRSHPASPVRLLLSLWRQRGLIWQLMRREVVGRYRGSVLGLAWSVFHPLMMLSVYTFVFGFVFTIRWDESSDGRADFAVMLFSGMIVHGLFADCINRAPGLILANANYVKKVVFPLEVLPLVTLGASLFQALVNISVLLIFVFILRGAIPVSALWLPVVIVPLLICTLGVAWFLASFGVFVRDVGQAIGIVTTVLLFLSPVFYPLSALPEDMRAWYMLNPLTPAIAEVRGVLLEGRMPDWATLWISGAAGALVAWTGFWWFQKTRRGFADVL